MIDHIGITVKNLVRSRAFYLETLANLGYVITTDTSGSIGFGVNDGYGKSTDPGGEFWLSEGALMVPPVHFAFSAASKMAVDASFRLELPQAESITGNRAFARNITRITMRRFCLIRTAII